MPKTGNSILKRIHWTPIIVCTSILITVAGVVGYELSYTTKNVVSSSGSSGSQAADSSDAKTTQGLSPIRATFKPTAQQSTSSSAKTSGSTESSVSNCAVIVSSADSTYESNKTIVINNYNLSFRNYWSEYNSGEITANVRDNSIADSASSANNQLDSLYSTYLKEVNGCNPTFSPPVHF